MYNAKSDLGKQMDIRSYFSPLYLANGAIYMIGYFICVYYGARGHHLTPLLGWTGAVIAQLLLFYRWDKTSLRVCVPLLLFALLAGVIQETIFIHMGVLSYPNEKMMPPLWLLSLYPLFSLTLNCSFSFINKNLLLAFCLGGGGALFSYLSGVKLKAVTLYTPQAYFAIFFSWGVCMTVLVLLNRKLLDAAAKKER